VLVTDASYKHTLSVVRMLAREGHGVYVVGKKKLHQALHSRYVKGSFCSTEPDVTKIVRYAVQRFAIDTFLPVGQESIGKAVESASGLPKSVKTLLPDREMFRVFNSKALTFKAMAGVIPENIPKTFSPRTLAEFRAESDQVPLPAVVKPALGLGGSEGLRYCRDQRSLREATEEQFRDGDWPVIQEYVSGQGEGMFIVAKAGRIYGYYQHQRLAEYPVAGGPSVLARSIFRRDLVRIVLRILKTFPWTGVAMFEFRRNRQGTPKLIEINPKFWGSIELAAHCGVNIPHVAVRLANGEPVPVQKSYLLDVRQSFPIPYGVYYILGSRKWRRIPEIFFPNNVNRFTDISLRDPLPNVLQLQGLFVKPLRVLKKTAKGT
jgi:predicted ATP-grasp superfamily ATP-dependent carboligase